MRHITSDLESLSFQSTNHQLIIIDHQWMIRSCNRAWQHGLHKLFLHAASRQNHYLHLMEAWAAQQKNLYPTKFARYLRHNVVPFNKIHTYDISVTTPHNEEKWFQSGTHPFTGRAFDRDQSRFGLPHRYRTEEDRVSAASGFERGTHSLWITAYLCGLQTHQG